MRQTTGRQASLADVDLTRYLYLDESKANDYIIAAAVVAPESRSELRRLMNSLRMPGQSRVHMVSEEARRRKAILSALAASDVQVEIFQASGRRAGTRTNRAACLKAIVTRASAFAHAKIVLELDESLRSQDRQDLVEFTGSASARGRIEYHHEKGRHEPLLWIPDAIAWAWARGGEWRRTVTEVVVDVHDV